MNQTTGHLIRMIGLLIEMLGVWGVYNSTGEQGPGSDLSFPGGSTVPPGLGRRGARVSCSG